MNASESYKVVMPEAASKKLWFMSHTLWRICSLQARQRHFCNKLGHPVALLPHGCAYLSDGRFRVSIYKSGALLQTSPETLGRIKLFPCVTNGCRTRIKIQDLSRPCVRLTGTIPGSSAEQARNLDGRLPDEAIRKISEAVRAGMPSVVCRVRKTGLNMRTMPAMHGRFYV